MQNSSYQALKECLRIAIEHLNNPKIDHRLAAIYDLEQFAHNYPQHHWKIMEILANFVRNNTPNSKLCSEILSRNGEVTSPSSPSSSLPLNATRYDMSQQEYKSQLSPTICTDIQVALTVIGRRNAQKDPENEQLDLSHTDLRGANLNDANLELTNLYQVNLSGANLAGANFSGAILSAANLSDANLAGANFSGAILSAANLSDANLAGAKLCRANLYLANLHGANLRDAMLEGANLRYAKLSTNF